MDDRTIKLVLGGVCVVGVCAWLWLRTDRW
jgi:hypothetical protein